MTLTVESRPIPSPPPEGRSQFSGWIRLNQALPLYEANRTGANRIGALPKGSLAYAEEPPDQDAEGIYWLQIDIPSPQGYIAAGNGKALYVQRYLQTPGASGGSVDGVAAEAGRFMAWGSSSARAGRPPSRLLATSIDGRTWQPVDTARFGDAWIRSVTYGPAGWLAMATLSDTNGNGSVWLWKSADGQSWRLAGTLAVNSSDGEASLIGSHAGYLIMLASYRSQSPNIDAWHSTDGLAWTQVAMPTDIGLTPRHLLAARSGFFGWPDQHGDTPNVKATYSADGRHWLTFQAPPFGGNGQVVALGDGLLAVDSSPVTGAPRVWRGTFSNGGVTWTPQSAAPPRKVGLASLASNGETAILFGWDRATDAPVAWSSTGGDWTRVTLPRGAFGGRIPSMAVGSSTGFVAVGSSGNLRADNPVIWSGTERGGWAAESAPIVTPIGERTDLRCPSRPVDAAAFASLDIPAAVICFGDSPITFRAYLGLCEGCNGASTDLYEPAWLADPQQNQLYLSPIKTVDQWWFNARRAGGLADDPAWQDHWVELTGHFDDPAARRCRWVPDPHVAENVLYSAQSTISNCRQQFVVTRIRVVNGP